MNRQKLTAAIICFLMSLLATSYAQQEKSVSTLWSDKKDCFSEGAFIIAIETYQNTYKVAACAPHGCRIAIREFGKKAHVGDYKNNPSFHWLSATEFETQINGSKKRFYHCSTK